MTRPELQCASCKQSPKECGYETFCSPGQSIDDYVWENEGTLDQVSGLFLCDLCYVNNGSPTSKIGWTATPENLKELRKYRY